MTEEHDEISVSMHGNGEMSLKGLSRESLERMMAAITLGAYFVTVENGKLITFPKWEKLPSPTEDKEMLPFWRTYMGPEQKAVFDEYKHSKEQVFSPSITITSLCGYYYSDENYKWEAEKLESYGFNCLRSRREIDQKFWELWYIPGLWATKGELKERLRVVKTDKAKLKAALEFLSRKCTFGSLDVSSQRIAMVMEGD